MLLLSQVFDHKLNLLILTDVITILPFGDRNTSDDNPSNNYYDISLKTINMNLKVML